MQLFNFISWFSRRDNSDSTVLVADNWDESYAFQRKFRSEHQLSASTLLEKLDLRKSMAQYLYSDTLPPSRKPKSEGWKLRMKLEQLKRYHDFISRGDGEVKLDKDRASFTDSDDLSSSDDSIQNLVRHLRCLSLEEKQKEYTDTLTLKLEFIVDQNVRELQKLGLFSYSCAESSREITISCRSDPDIEGIRKTIMTALAALGFDQDCSMSFEVGTPLA